jgi:hypothetical protein
MSWFLSGRSIERPRRFAEKGMVVVGLRSRRKGSGRWRGGGCCKSVGDRCGMGD